MRSSFLHTALLASSLSSFVAGSKHILPLKRTDIQTPSSHALASNCTNSTHLTHMKGVAGFSVPIQFGQDTFDVLFDTGASDFWLASSNFSCLRRNPPGFWEPLAHLAQKACKFGPLVNHTFDGGNADQTFHAGYQDGDWAAGKFGYEKITLAGITVQNQQVGLADSGVWEGDGQVSGLLGFAYPAATRACKNGHNTTFTPFFWNAIGEGKVESIFSLALSREYEGDAGQLGLGCLPDVEHKGNFASTPLQKDYVLGGSAKDTNFTLYNIVPEAYIVGGATLEKASDLTGNLVAGRTFAQPGPNETIPNNASIFVDSGAEVMFLPDPVAKKFNQRHVPPAKLDDGEYWVECNATVPTLGVRIAGKDFYIEGRDLLNQHSKKDESGLCLSGVQSGDELYVLGQPFLKNVVAVFDIGKSEMRFAAR